MATWSSGRSQKKPCGRNTQGMCVAQSTCGPLLVRCEGGFTILIFRNKAVSRGERRLENHRGSGGRTCEVENRISEKDGGIDVRWSCSVISPAVLTDAPSRNIIACVIKGGEAQARDARSSLPAHTNVEQELFVGVKHGAPCLVAAAAAAQTEAVTGGRKGRGRDARCRGCQI